MENEMESFILKLTEEFEKSISQEEKAKEDLVEAFKKYMYLAVKTLQESESKFIQKDTESIKSVLSNMGRDLIDGDIDLKKRELLEDKVFEEIIKISVELFEIAKNKMDGKEEKNKMDIKAETNKLSDLLEKVREYNKEQAETFVSEALIDSQYITSEKTNILSLRLYHYKEGKEIKERRKQ